MAVVQYSTHLHTNST